MLRPFLLAGAALAAAPPLAAQQPPAAVTAPAIAFTEWKLANGLTVIAIPDPTTANVMTSVWYDVGSKNDPQDRSGFAHLFEHILSRKTENMPYNMINRLTEDVGGQRRGGDGRQRGAGEQDWAKHGQSLDHEHGFICDRIKRARAARAGADRPRGDSPRRWSRS